MKKNQKNNPKKIKKSRKKSKKSKSERVKKKKVVTFEIIKVSCTYFKVVYLVENDKRMAEISVEMLTMTNKD